MPTFNTTFSTTATAGSTAEAYDVTIEWGSDFSPTPDGFDDIKVTITQTAGTNSGTEDILGVAFDVNSLPAGTVITEISKDGGLGTTSSYVTTTGIDDGNVSDDGGTFTDPGFSTSGGSSAEPYDAFVKVSENGSGEGIVQTFTFIIENPGQNLDAPTYLNNTDWWIRTTSTDGGEGSAKIADIIGTILICFAPGTLIATPGGETVVEDLQIGDLVRTTAGRDVPVKWMGRQTVYTSFAGPKMQPVRFRAGALGNGLPHTDLTVTADHGMIVDGMVVNASALVNGTTIDYVPVAELPEKVTYYHIETEDHDEVLANGAPAETFVDYVDRKNFDNYDEYLDLYAADRLIREMDKPRISGRQQLPKHLCERFGIETVSASASDRMKELMKRSSAA